MDLPNYIYLNYFIYIKKYLLSLNFQHDTRALGF